MEYVNYANCPVTGVMYFAEFFPSFESGNFEGVIDFEPINNTSYSDVEISTSNGVSITKNSYGKVEFEVYRGQSDSMWVDLTNTQSDANPNYIRIEIPELEVFRICSQILDQGDEIKDHSDYIKDRYEDRSEGEYLLNFRAEAEKILSIENHVKLLSRLSSFHPRVGKIIKENRYNQIENRILNSREPHYIRDFDDFLEKVEMYNIDNNLGRIELQEVVNNVLSELFKRVENSGYKHNQADIKRIIPSSGEQFKKLSIKNCCLYLSIYLYSQKNRSAREFFSDWVEYNSVKEINDYSPRLERLNISKNADIQDLFELLYELGIWESRGGNYNGTLPIFEAVYRRADDYLNDYKIETSQYQSLLRRGYRHLEPNSERAREIFGEAASVVRNSPNRLEYDSSQMLEWAISGKAKAIVKAYQENADHSSAITYLSEFINSELTEIEEDSDLARRINGLRYEIIARQKIKTRSLELAKQSLNDAIEEYRQSNAREDEKKSIELHVQREVIEGYQLEAKSYFDDAADKYIELSNICDDGLNNTNLAKAFQIRSLLNRAKYCITNGNINEAKNNIDKFENIGGGGREGKILSAVIEYLEDYNRQTVTENSLPEHTYYDRRSDLLFETKTDYSSSISVLSAVQHLRKFGFESEVLDPMISISLHNSFIPRDSTEFDDSELKSIENTEFSYLTELPASMRWQARLPSHIHYKLEELTIKEVSSVGDRSHLADEITKILELFLVVICEYYGKRIPCLSPPDKNTLGPLIDYINKIPSEYVSNINKIQEILSEPVLENESIGLARNSTHHGETIHISEQEYLTIRDCVINALNLLSSNTPVIIEIVDKSELGPYLMTIHWGGAATRRFLNTESDLKVGQLYYLPPESIEDSPILAVEEQSIFTVDRKKAQNVRDVGEKRP